MACLLVIQIEIQAVWILIGKRLLKNPVDASNFYCYPPKMLKGLPPGEYGYGEGLGPKYFFWAG